MVKSGYKNTQSWGERIGNVLRSVHPVSTAKFVARDLNVPVRTVEKWLDGASTPSLDHFARILAAYPRALLVFAPSVAWVPLALAAIEQEALEAQLATMPLKRQRALDALRRRA